MVLHLVLAGAAILGATPVTQGVASAPSALAPQGVAPSRVESAPTAATEACAVGAYAGPGGDVVVLTETAQAAGDLRYTFLDGRFGRTGEPAVRCEQDAVQVSRQSGAERWPRVALRVTPARFRSGDVTLAGELIEPAATKKRYPLVVLVHGSENTASIHRNAYTYLLAAQGVAAFVFDKRGTGASGGSYNQNFVRLADDVVAASAEAKRLAKGRYSRFGLVGGSQGGWVAPRAANGAGAEFVAVGFGLLIDPLEEDSEQVATELRAMGYGEDVLRQAREVTDATGEIMAQHFESGYDQLAAVCAKYGSEPWFSRIKGEFTGDVLAANEAALRREGRAKHDNLDIIWRYDALGELRQVRARQLWVVAGADREAPPATTLERLRALRYEGRPIEVVVFPDTDHGMYEFEQEPDGARRYTRITEGYFRLLADWVKGVRKPPYGRAQLPSSGAPAIR